MYFIYVLHGYLNFPINQWGGKTEVNGADLPFNIYHVDLRFFRINLNVKQRQIVNKIQNLIGKFK
jgi:hypothetical protein